ncbi:hypothetical protein Pint_05662 [Pistacia integerrima]|uniref:Uncharacterized protein n=1 Tax=Pistacia integerrima TaxID=434235 RepID=A0ACC0Z8S5_9ROSI|nr:hypothetical protein Pint_05662 [Pistacia integerrima]
MSGVRVISRRLVAAHQSILSSS